MSLKYAQRRYYTHHLSAAKRKIPFLITFDEWYNWWLSNGVDKNKSQGPRTKDTLCMCRFNDQGPYELSNIYCASLEKNLYDVKKFSPEKLSKKIKTPLGVFDSQKDAAKAHSVHRDTIKYRVKTKPTDYYYL